MRTNDDALHAQIALKRGIPAIAVPPPGVPPVLPAIASPGQPEPAQAMTAAPLPTIAPPPPRPAAEEPPRHGSRRAAQLAWVAVFAVLIGALLASIIWAVSSRLRHGAAAPEPSAGPEVVENEAPEPEEPAPEPAPPPAQPPDNEVALRLAEAALAFEKSDPTAHAEALLQLRRALLAGGESPMAAKLRARLAVRQQALTEAASRQYAELTDRVKALCSEDRFGDALRAAAAFPQESAYGVWAERVEADLARAGADAERRYLTLAADAAAALGQQDFEQALRAYKAIKKLDIPWISRAGEGLLAAASVYAGAELERLEEAASRRAVLEHRKAFGELTRDFALVHEEIKKRDYAKALELCKAIPEALRQDDRGQAVKYLDRKLEILVGLWSAIEKGPAAARGKPFTLYGKEGVIDGFAGTGLKCELLLRIPDAGERPWRQPIWRLPGLQLGQLAEWAIAREPPAAAATKLGVLYLTEGEAARAREKLQEAAKLGADVSAYIEELDADVQVRGALTAHQQGRWAEARKLAELALGHYATAPPVILNHPSLMKALNESLVKLGEPTTVPPVAPSPLPLPLRRLLLLPETRLGAAAPADPLAAHFATPLQRGSPVRLGLDDWRDFTLTLRLAPGEPGRFLLAARVSEPRPGEFAYYYVTADGQQLVLGRRSPAGNKVLASKPYVVRADRASHLLTFDLSGSTLSVSLGRDPLFEATDTALSQGQIAIAVVDSPIHVEELSVTFAPPAKRRPGAPGRERD